MSSDFLDNLTLRMGATERLPLQPRLASRFEEATPDTAAGVPEVPPLEAVQVRPVVPALSPGLPSEPSLSTSNRSERVQRLGSDFTATPNPNSERVIIPNSGAPLDSAHLRPDITWEQRLATVTRELDRLTDRFERISEPSPPLRIETRPVMEQAVGQTEAPSVSTIQQIRHEHYSQVETTSVVDQSRHINVSQTILTGQDLSEHFASADRALPASHPPIERRRENLDRSLPPELRTGRSAQGVSVRAPRLPEHPARSGRSESSIPDIVIESKPSAGVPGKTIHVSIGRLEVRAVSSPPVTGIRRPASHTKSITSLEDYLRRRSGGAR